MNTKLVSIPGLYYKFVTDCLNLFFFIENFENFLEEKKKTSEIYSQNRAVVLQNMISLSELCCQNSSFSWKEIAVPVKVPQITWTVGSSESLLLVE